MDTPRQALRACRAALRALVLFTACPLGPRFDVEYRIRYQSIGTYIGLDGGDAGPRSWAISSDRLCFGGSLCYNLVL
jgi:hypothetical protein